MYLPDIYTKFSEKYPDIFRQYKELGIACRNAGPLNEKDQNLVKLGIAIGASSRGGIMSHTRKALSAGATQDEILQVVLLGLTTTGFPQMMAAMKWVDSVLSEQAAA
jgi:4-carboxymuconolactone decarboxylase